MLTIQKAVPNPAIDSQIYARKLTDTIKRLRRYISETTGRGQSSSGIQLSFHHPRADQHQPPTMSASTAAPTTRKFLLEFGDGAPRHQKKSQPSAQIQLSELPNTSIGRVSGVIEGVKPPWAASPPVRAVKPATGGNQEDGPTTMAAPRSLENNRLLYLVQAPQAPN